MGTVDETGRFQGGSRTLSSTPLVARIVPDVSGIDKIFNYLVPSPMEPDLAVGDRVRVDLHGRRIGGWVVGLGRFDHSGINREDFSEVSLDRLMSIIKRSGAGVITHLVPLALEIARDHIGPRRAVLHSASAPHVLSTIGRAIKGNPKTATDAIADAIETSGAEAVVLRIGPLQTVLSTVVQLTTSGSVLVVCPTMRMAALGAASLRRRGCTVALISDDWDVARAGVDVVIGARSAVWAPCPFLTAIVVVDEHDESLKQERVPTWHAREIAIRRGVLEGATTVLASPIPSPEATEMVRRGHAELIVHKSGSSWPQIIAEDLNAVPVRGSLASTTLLQSIRIPQRSVLCILNTKGRARLLACKQCRMIARCSKCNSALSAVDDASHVCYLCGTHTDAICQQCGRTAFLVLRSGISRLREQLVQACTSAVVEVQADTSFSSIGDHGGVFIGTEALLHRVPRADEVVFLDFDTEMLAPRVTAARDALALVVRASRVVGRSGSVVLQTRHPQHTLISTLIQLSDDPSAIQEWETHDLSMRKMLHLPPFSTMARVISANPDALVVHLSERSISFAREKDGACIVRAPSVEELRKILSDLKLSCADRLRIEMEPARY